MPEIKKYLNRDGLDEYNSLLPHSSAEMQTYVNDWLDEHPEATTTVQDGAITEPKLADKSVSLRTLADDTVHMLKGAILTGNLSGEVLTADDAYSAPSVALTVEGKSTQNGTPTPDAPVEIVSLEQVRLWFAGRNLFDITTATFSGNATSPAVKTETGVTATANLTDGWAYVVTSIPIFGEQTVTISTNPSTTTPLILVAGYNANNTITVSQQIRTNTGTVRLPSGTVRLALYFYARPTVSGAVGDTCTYNDIQLELGSTATEYQPYNGTTILLQLTQALRSLPSDARDELHLTWVRNSEREGYAWYKVTGFVRIGFSDLGDFDWTPRSANHKWFARILSMRSNVNVTQRMCSAYTVIAAQGHTQTPANNTISPRSINGSDYVYVRDDRYPPETTTPAEFKAAVTGVKFQYLMNIADYLTPDYGEIELPIIPAPNFTIWSDPSTGLQVEYVRDSNLVIQRIEQAIADQ